MSLLCLRHRLLRSTRLSRLVVLFIRVDESRENSLTKNLPVPVIPLDREAKGSRGRRRWCSPLQEVVERTALE